jgi:glycerophosphoryl diester phosphodiesterase
MAAFEAALFAKADAIELDVQLSLDGVVVVMHDERLERTTNGSGWLKDWTWSMLQTLNAGRGERIPSLVQVLSRMQKETVFLHIELKNDLYPYPDLENKVAALIEQFAMERRCIISSFNHNSLYRLHRRAPHLETAALFSHQLVRVWKYAQAIGVSGIHPFYPHVTPQLVRKAHEAGMAVRTYTVNDAHTFYKLAQIGVDAIFTDDPERMAQLI